MTAYIPHTQILEPLFENTLESKLFGQDIALDPSFSNVAQGGLQGCWLGAMKTKCTLNQGLQGHLWDQNLGDQQTAGLPLTWAAQFLRNLDWVYPLLPCFSHSHMEPGSAWAPGHGVTQTGPEHQSYQAIEGIPTFLLLLRSSRTTPFTQQPIWHSLQHPSILHSCRPVCMPLGL